MKKLLFILGVLVSTFVDAQESCGFPVSVLRSGFEAGERQPLVALPIDGTPLSVNIVSPIEGATIPANRLQVYGSLTGPANIGVMVNGDLALANASQFSTRPIVLDPVRKPSP